jgi:hypothetical protein
MKTPLIPVSWGELIDKITILEIKAQKIVREPAASNIRKELDLLSAIANPASHDPAVAQLKSELGRVNAALWEIEDGIRLKEAKESFDSEFIALARSVYQENDLRAAIKRQINKKLASEIVEEKSYEKYQS